MDAANAVRRAGPSLSKGKRVITREHLRLLLHSPAERPTLVLVEGRERVLSAVDLGTAPYRGAVELLTRDDLAAQLGTTDPPDHELDEVASRLQAAVAELGG